MKEPIHDSDEQLVSLLRESDAAAFEAIYNRYAEELYRHARRLIPGREDCEEIIQDIFEYLWKARQKAGIKSLRAYLYKAVAHKVMDHLKKGYLHQRYAEHYRLFEAVYDQNDNRDAVEEMIESGLQQLPDRVQMAIRLRLTENLSNDEIARRMQVTNKTIENYMHIVYSHFRASRSYFAKADP